MTEALDFVEPHIRPAWLGPQYRHALDGHGDQGYEREGQQQVLRPSFEGIRDSVRDALGMRLDKLAREFATTHDMKVKKEIERLAAEYDKAQTAVVVRREVRGRVCARPLRKSFGFGL